MKASKILQKNATLMCAETERINNLDWGQTQYRENPNNPAKQTALSLAIVNLVIQSQGYKHQGFVDKPNITCTLPSLGADVAKTILSEYEQLRTFACMFMVKYIY